MIQVRCEACERLNLEVSFWVCLKTIALFGLGEDGDQARLLSTTTGYNRGRRELGIG